MQQDIIFAPDMCLLQATELLPLKACNAIAPPADAGLLEAAAGQACQVGAWGAFSACVRTGLNEWSQSRSRPLLLPGAKCPELLESTPCGESCAVLEP